MSKKYLSMDGNTAAAHVAYAFSEVASIYPITPSSPMAENAETWAAQGKKNIFGSAVNVIEMQSEAGASWGCSRSFTRWCLSNYIYCFTRFIINDSNLYKIQGELLPGMYSMWLQEHLQHVH